MNIRPYEDRDRPAVLEILERDYGGALNFPLDEARIILVIADDQDRAREVLMVRPTIEAYTLIDKSDWATPGMKFELFQRAHERMCREALALGYKDGYMFTESRSWAKRLKKLLGWDSARPEGWRGMRRFL